MSAAQPLDDARPDFAMGAPAENSYVPMTTYHLTPWASWNSAKDCSPMKRNIRAVTQMLNS